jgi:hypothetical protein
VRGEAAELEDAKKPVVACRGAAAVFFAREELLLPQGSELAADGILVGRDLPCGDSPSRTLVMKG